MCEIKEGTAKIAGVKIPVFRKEITCCNQLEVTAGTNGYRGGDSGYGSRTYVKIVDVGGTDMTVKAFDEDSGEGGKGIEIAVGGDSELRTMIKAFKFVTKVLEELANEDYN